MHALKREPRNTFVTASLVDCDQQISLILSALVRDSGRNRCHLLKFIKYGLLPTATDLCFASGQKTLSFKCGGRQFCRRINLLVCARACF